MNFISPAFAQETDTKPVTIPENNTIASDSPLTAPTPPEQDPVSMFLPLIVIFLIFYFLLIRPQQKRMKAHQQLVGGLKRGDKIVTSGGILGTIQKLDNDKNTADIEIAPNVTIQVYKNTITGLADTTTTEKTPAKKTKKS